MEPKTLQDLVVTAASQHDRRVAVTFDRGSLSGGSVSLSYSEAAELWNDLSRVLRMHCSKNHGLIALYCHTDLYLPVWIMGILQVPAAYVPLDPESPALHSVRIMERCATKYCVVQSDLLEGFQTTFSKLIIIQVCVVLSSHYLTLVRLEFLPQPDGGEEMKMKSIQDSDLSASAKVAGDVIQGDVAYVLHTSGTTGLPKIVRVPHKCILPNILHLRSLFQMSPEDVVFLASPLTFDPSVVEIFLALSSGAQLLIVPTVIKKMPSRLARVLFKNHRTTVLQVTPTLLGRFGRGVLNKVVLSATSSLRVLALGGEACPSPNTLRHWRQEGNSTHIYNIYGITEVSCWACCYKVPESLLHSTISLESSVPLGTPLSDTTVEVRDEHGCIVTEGEGQVFIGGESRVCLLDDEVTAVPGTMRATGDWVLVKDTQLYYLGRRDRLIKRHGQRMHLDSLQQAVMSLIQVESCVVGLYEDSRLVAFVVASTSGAQKASLPQPVNHGAPVSAEHQRDISSPMVHPEETGSSKKGLQRAIFHQLSALLPRHSIPDMLVLIPALPLSSHGKVDMAALRKMYERQRENPESHPPPGDVAAVRERLQSLWKDMLGLAEEATIKEESNFLFSGGDSLKALCLCDSITSALGVTSPGLLEVVLDGSFSDVLHHIATEVLMLPPNDSCAALRQAKKRQADPLSAVSTRRENSDSHFTTAAKKLHGVKYSSENGAIKVIRRGGCAIEMNDRDSGNRTAFHTDTVVSVTRKDSMEKTDKNQLLAASIYEQSVVTDRHHVVEPIALKLSLSWSSDTGRCVDASPVLLVHSNAESHSDPTKTTVFIGSHSHRIQALDLATGRLLWERVLGDRIESSAAVTPCGTLVVVGCYDGCVYFLCVESGETRWVFETGDAVKSCPTSDPLTGLVIVGSHDGHVYALDPQGQQCVWKHQCGGGAVFSSPCLHPTLRQLYVASLGGHVLCLNPDTGAVLWTYSREVPFFSSPSTSSNSVVIGSVDGNICCLNHTGKLLWQFLTKGPVFSSPCFTPDQQRVFCGSHDGCVYCLNSADGSLVWSFQTSGKVYSSPCVFDGSTLGSRGLLVALASTEGTVWVLNGEDGTLAASMKLSGELFSSPVVWEHFLVVGCRNDFVYCLELALKEEPSIHS